MKHPVPRIGCAAVCITLSLALGCGCAVLPPASDKPAASASASAVPTDKNGNPLYDSTRLDDGQLRALYGYDNAGNSCTILCGSKVLYQSSRSENVNLLQDTVTDETNYWFRSWSDPTGRGGRRSSLYDKGGNEVLAFDGEQSASLQNGLLVLQESRLVDNEYQDDYTGYGTCQVIDLSTGRALPAPEGAYRCIVSGDALVFSCYARPASLADDEWDEDPYLSSWVIVQSKDGTQLYRADSTTALSLSYAKDLPEDWVELDHYDATGERTTQTLYSTSTGEELPGYAQTCGGGTASFQLDDRRYELRDMNAEGYPVIGTFDAMPDRYFPGYVVLWRVNGDFGYDLYDLVSGETTPLYAASSTSDTIALYAEDGTLKLYSTATGELVWSTTVEPLENQQSVMMDNTGSGYVWLELRDNDRYETTATRVYGADGLVSDLTHLLGTYTYLNFLTTTPEGRPLYYGTRDAAGSYNALCDVLDENGNTVLQGLGSCYGYYSNSLNQLPEHVFVARRGFYYGWMDTSGQWLFCQSIFSSLNSDDELGY